MALFAQWKPHVLPLERSILINKQINGHLEWWNCRERFVQGVLLKPPLPSHTLFTDPSLSGWGVHLEPEGLLFHGVWSLDQSAALSATHQCLRDESHSISSQTVSSTCQQYHSHNSHGQFISGSLFEEAGGIHSPSLCMEVWETLRWCDKRNIHLFVRHVPGKSNILADQLSRLSKPISTEWCLDQAVCNLILSCSYRLPKHRPVCDSSQQQTTSLCFPDSRQHSSSNRRSIKELGPDPCIRISSVRSDSGNNQQDSSTSVQNCSSSPFLARSIFGS